jgi:isochorismate hydrolase
MVATNKPKQEELMEPFILTVLQFMPLSRQPCRYNENFMGRLYENIRDLKWSERQENILLVYACKARGLKPKQRSELCFKAIALLNKNLKKMK